MYVTVKRRMSFGVTEGGRPDLKPILKWPGGKSREIAQIYGMIPDHKRYIEPFFGGGALFFHLQPKSALINDNSRDLMFFYRQVKEQDSEMQACLTSYGTGFRAMLELCRSRVTSLLDIMELLSADEEAAKAALSDLLDLWIPEIAALFSRAVIYDLAAFRSEMERSVWDKLVRTRDNHRKRPFSPEDLAENLVTGFSSGFYMYARQIYNDCSLEKKVLPDGKKCANFFFVREMCYGSMFRYNAKGEFNIPYGGMSYNRKDFSGKVQAIYTPEMKQLFAGTEIHCSDFEDFLNHAAPTKDDFIFLDPPYDTEFSDYEGTAFTRLDHARLALALSRTKAKFLLIIKDTPYISGLYSQGFYVQSFDKQYSYNVRSRNNRSAHHLIITNYPCSFE